MPCYCYIVECADGTYYTGWALDLQRRVDTHNKGRGAKYTRMRLPVKLVYMEEQPDRKSAMKREIAIKRMGRDGKRKLIVKSKHGNVASPRVAGPRRRKKTRRQVGTEEMLEK